MIRRANASDMQDLLSLWHEMMRSHKGMHPDFRIAENADVAIASNFTTLFEDSTAAFIVAEEEDKVVGMLVAQVRHGLPYTATELSGYIRDVAVAKSFRGKGIGRELVKAGVDFLKSKNVEYIDLITGSSNNISNDFWQKLGFKETLKVRTLLMGS